MGHNISFGYTRGAVEEQHEEAIHIRVASLASKAPNFSILASFDAVWLLKIWFGFSLFSGFFFKKENLCNFSKIATHHQYYKLVILV